MGGTDDRREAIRAEVVRQGFVRVVDLARRFGISRVTAWRDVDQLAEAGLVVKFHGGAAIPGSLPDMRGLTQAGRPRREGLTIGMQVPVGHHYYADVVAGVRQVCDGVGAKLLVATSGYGDAARDRQTLDTLVAAGADGLLTSPAEHDSEAQGVPASVIADLGRPVVVVERELGCMAAGSWGAVLTSYEPAVRTAFQHLRVLGHERIGLVTVPGGARIRARIITTFDELAAATGAVGCRSWTDVVNADVSREDVVENVDTTFVDIIGSGVTAVIVYGDRLASAIAYEAVVRGVDIPGQLSIVAIGDEVAAHAAPPLTAIAQRRHLIGTTAARMLLAHLDGSDEPSGVRIMIDPEFIVRESTTAPRNSRRATGKQRTR